VNGLLIPADAPFSTEQQAWLAGFLAGVASARSSATAAPTSTVTVDVLYGSQTGNAERVAEDLVSAARGQGLAATAKALDDVEVEALASMERVLIVTSTYGEGEMPDNAELFWESLAADTAPRLEGVRFSVLSLGDSGYDDFCQAGKLLDLRFEQLGATRVSPRVDCDVDFEDDAAAWSGTVVGLFAAEGGNAPAEVAVPQKVRSKWNRKNPYPSRLAVNRVLSGAGSAKEIRHYELDLADSGIEYAAGDALAVVPVNDPVLVEEFLAEFGLDGDTVVDDVSLHEKLSHGWEISAPSKDLISALVNAHPDGELASVHAHDDRSILENYLWGKDILDLVRATPNHGLDLTALTGVLRPLAHRAYSISSSPLHSPDRIHLTVASVRHGTDRPHHGVASTFLADRLGQEDPVGIFLQPNASFRVPADDDAPVVMIGPGTGVAPFRAFLQERAGRGAKGRNWLFFGDQHQADDFIYAEELQQFQADGVLTRLDLAFSRDQAEKVYVQTRMKQNAKELFSWLEDGASVFVCGDASRMAKDVDAALHEVIAEQRGRGLDDAAAYVNDLKRSKRYVRDVY